MKSLPATDQDRPSTWAEVRAAAFSTVEDRVLEICFGEQSYREIRSESGENVRFSAEEFEFFADLDEAEQGLPN